MPLMVVGLAPARVKVRPVPGRSERYTLPAMVRGALLRLLVSVLLPPVLVKLPVSVKPLVPEMVGLPVSAMLLIRVSVLLP